MRDTFAEILNEANWVKTYPVGRTCSRAGCATILSRFNEADVCEIHKPEPDWYIRDGECFAECPDCGSFRKVTKPQRGVSVCPTCRRRRLHTASARRDMVTSESGPRDAQTPGDRGHHLRGGEARG